MPARSSYHRGVVAEAITNMLAHRDLALRDLPSRLHVFDHSLEFVNSRRSVGFSPVAQKAIRYGMPERLNPRLRRCLTSSAYGLKLSFRDCRRCCVRRNDFRIGKRRSFRLMMSFGCGSTEVFSRGFNSAG